MNLTKTTAKKDKHAAICDHEVQESGKQYGQQANKDSKINLCSPEAESEIKQGAE